MSRLVFHYHCCWWFGVTTIAKTTLSLLVHSKGWGGVVELCKSRDLSEFLIKSKSWTDQCLQHFCG